jgi:hypothetical protein
MASLDIELSDEETGALTAPYTPRYDFQGVSDDAELAHPGDASRPSAAGEWEFTASAAWSWSNTAMRSRSI